MPGHRAEARVSDEQWAGTAVENFADELRAWRERQGLSQAELGARMGYSGSHISSVETMARVPTLEFAKQADEALETPGTFKRLHVRITKEAYPSWFSPFVHFEARAARIHNWYNHCITGLLQVEDYARAIIASGRPDLPADAIERDVTARMERQHVLDREELFAWFVISEAALRSAYGGPDVMRRQMIKLAEAVSRPRITIQVFPFSHQNCPGSQGPVTIFDFEDSAHVAYAEGHEAGRIIESPADMAKLVMMFDHLRAGALTPTESARFIDSLIRGDHHDSSFRVKQR
jgi:transcriptional regulator with XRE-family HTH domain